MKRLVAHCLPLVERHIDHVLCTLDTICPWLKIYCGNCFLFFDYLQSFLVPAYQKSFHIVCSFRLLVEPVCFASRPLVPSSTFFPTFFVLINYKSKLSLAFDSVPFEPIKIFLLSKHDANCRKDWKLKTLSGFLIQIDVGPFQPFYASVQMHVRICQKFHVYIILCTNVENSSRITTWTALCVQLFLIRIKCSLERSISPSISLDIDGQWSKMQFLHILTRFPPALCQNHVKVMKECQWINR